MASAYDKASLVMLPHAVKEDKLYSVKPEDRSGDFTFSRGSDIQATRVNSSGFIEKAKVNLLTKTEDAENAVWTKSSGVVVTNNNATAPDGTNTAISVDLVTINKLIGQTPTISGSVVASSVYIKGTSGETLSWNVGGVGVTITLDGTWQEFKREPQTASANAWNISNFNSTTATSFDLWHPQLNWGLVAQDYVQNTTTTAVVEGLTADLPRLDYSGGASCPSLLLEPSRTNYATQSEYIGAWVQSDVTGTDNFAVSPEGVQNASKVSASLTPLIHFIQLTGGAVGNIATISLFAKADTGSYIQLTNPYSGAIFANFDVATGVVGTKGSSCISSDIEDYGNGWYRCIAVFDNTGFNSNIYRHYIVPSASASFGQSWLPASDTSLFIYGHSWEAGSYPTSYIPTYGAAANRGVEYYEKSSATDLIGQTEGVLFVDFIPNTDVVSTKWLAFLGFNSTYVGIYVVNGTNKIRLDVADATAQATFDTASGIVEGQRYKCAIAYKENDFAAYVNGVQVGTDSSGSVPALDLIRSYYNLSSIEGTKINQLLLFKTRLTNAELAALTTL